MKKFSFILGGAFFILNVFSSTIQAQNLVQEDAFSFIVPKGWEKKKIGEEMYCLISTDQETFIVISKHNFKNIEEVKANVDNIKETSGLSVKEQPVRIPTGAVMTKYSGEYEGEPVIAHMISVMSDEGGGVNVFAFSNIEKPKSKNKLMAINVATSVGFR